LRQMISTSRSKLFVEIEKNLGFKLRMPYASMIHIH
jgi:hypothetical protein